MSRPLDHHDVPMYSERDLVRMRRQFAAHEFRALAASLRHGERPGLTGFVYDEIAERIEARADVLDGLR